MNVKIDQLILTKRRTISIQIKADGSLIVRAPKCVDKKHIFDFVTKKENWIITTQKKIADRNLERNKRIAMHKWASEDGILLLGQRLANIEFKDKTAQINWYKKEAIKYIEPRLEFFAKKSGYNYNSLKITSARKRWGSCSSRGNINFSWRLIRAPEKIVDYVIAHEVSHLAHKNHSVRFWNFVETLMPDYKIHHKWLRENGFLLDL